ncbi:uncharacterized protein LOC111401496 isoform X1 [Olea europaea var. sylvestris]|uniref:uncharacterized protein LOC111401496 isoform X1 n=1 Tax=Olea europaea var. sylvestris TaxID=158386 RepID=UPI000C1D26C6|nr:uncharacterized protein LOC111401496 isoform X1 [Olea europaea var. sylvestris]XP_022885012.1 uncharacterized protein LOC111401496 isoform X1 [Olea europaea var. sylvestris]XP_022885013.1 uncharacterized protein LOC111401496 isoform X1 [Olea europaea var. sylvestris]
MVSRYRRSCPIRTREELKMLVMTQFHEKQIFIKKFSDGKQGDELNREAEIGRPEEEQSAPKKEKNSTMESGKKEKGLAATLPKITPTCDFPSIFDKIWGSRDNRSRSNEITIIDNRRSIEFLASPPSPQSKKDSKLDVYGVTVIVLNHEMMNGETNFVNGLANTTQIHRNKQLGLVSKLTQTIALGPLKGKPILKPTQANITLPFQSRHSYCPSTPPIFCPKQRASAEIGHTVDGKEQLSLTPPPSQLKVDNRGSSEQAWEGNFVDKLNSKIKAEEQLLNVESRIFNLNSHIFLFTI